MANLQYKSYLLPLLMPQELNPLSLLLQFYVESSAGNYQLVELSFKG